ncbi:hypothetical protein [Bernardetia sp. MNP-M8]|uniref:hypothetical protein n=1 Tax=Bernardetia sp. MNP-M8 TaxID=3127470 RepID=UPI0030D54EAE
MKSVSAKVILFLIFLVISFSSCQNKKTNENSQENATNSSISEEITSSNSASVSSKASEFQTKPCELLTEEIIKKYVTIDKEIEKEFFEYKDSKYPMPARCSYSWKKPNADEATKNSVKEVGKMVKTDGKHEMDMKKMTPDYSIAISIHNYAGSAQSFIPIKLTDEQIEAQARKSKEMAMKNKTFQNMNAADQEKVTNLAAEKTRNTLTNMRDKTVVVEGIGEAAYWNPTGFDNTFMILSGGKSINLEIYVSPNREENIEIAKKIAKEIL